MLTQRLDELHSSASTILENLESIARGCDELADVKCLQLNRHALGRELDQGRYRVLEWFRTQVHEALAEGLDLRFSDKFLDEALGVGDDRDSGTIWTLWNSTKVVAHRERTFTDLRQEEWRQSLQTAARTIGIALGRHEPGQVSRWKKRPYKLDELEVWCNLYERDASHPTMLRTSSREKIGDLHITLRVIETLHLDCPYQNTALLIPLVLNPAYGRIFEPRSIFRWHETYNLGVPRVRVMAEQSLILKFASSELLQQVKDQLLPLSNI